MLGKGHAAQVQWGAYTLTAKRVDAKVMANLAELGKMHIRTGQAKDYLPECFVQAVHDSQAANALPASKRPRKSSVPAPPPEPQAPARSRRRRAPTEAEAAASSDAVESMNGLLVDQGE